VGSLLYISHSIEIPPNLAPFLGQTFLKDIVISWVWWHMGIIQALRLWEEEAHQLEIVLLHRPVLKKLNQNELIFIYKRI
jgi:hypothetical protein